MQHGLLAVDAVHKNKELNYLVKNTWSGLKSA
jgi:hypothetical protein